MLAAIEAWEIKVQAILAPTDQRTGWEERLVIIRHGRFTANSPTEPPHPITMMAPMNVLSMPRVKSRLGTYGVVAGLIHMSNEPTPPPKEPPVKDPLPYSDPVSPPNGPDVPMHDPITPGHDQPRM
jgi:hypothetical protein